MEPENRAVFPSENEVAMFRPSDCSAHMLPRNGRTSMQTADFGGRVWRARLAAGPYALSALSDRSLGLTADCLSSGE